MPWLQCHYHFRRCCRGYRENLTEADTTEVEVSRSKVKSGWTKNNEMGFDEGKDSMEEKGEKSHQEVLKGAQLVVGELVDHVCERSKTQELEFEVHSRQENTFGHFGAHESPKTWTDEVK